MSRETERRFNELMGRERMQELTKEKFYMVICHDWSLPEGKQVFVYDKFRTKAERDKWYEESGREIENLYGVKMEMPEDPMSKEEAGAKTKEQKSGQ